MHSRAIDDLRYIRETMRRAGSFTSVPGWGGVLMGVCAVVAMAIAAQVATEKDWFFTWVAAAFIALLLGGWAMDRKAVANKESLLSGPGRKFAFALMPALVAGTVMSVALYHYRIFHLLPGIWLLMYGTGIVSAGAHSVRIVPVMGLFFVGLGTLALFAPAQWGNWFMGLGFGGLHIAFGMHIARKYGG
ncbi:MAG: hypothetical protein ACR2RL_21145 [Gammaproteobacteria bacterium]